MNVRAPTTLKVIKYMSYFSSVPTRMGLFTWKKYVFLIERSLSNSASCFYWRSTNGYKFYRGFVVIPTDLY